MGKSLFSMRRTAESRGFGRICFIFSPRYLGTTVCLGVCFCWGLVCVLFSLSFVLVTFSTQVFLRITASPLHRQENLWPTRLRARPAMAKKKITGLVRAPFLHPSMALHQQMDQS